MATAMVECVKCKVQLAANAADFTADGMVCKPCAMKLDIAAKLGGGDGSLADAAYAFDRSTAKKHLWIGIAGVVGGGALLGLLAAMMGAGAISPRLTLLGIAIFVGGLVEIGNGVSRFSALKKPAK